MSEQPPPGWYPDPGGEPGRLRWWNGRAWSLDTQLMPQRTAEGIPPLDRSVLSGRERSPEPWGWYPVLLPLLTLVAVIVVSRVAVATISVSGRAARLIFGVGLTFGLDTVLVLAVWRAGNAIAARGGGWGPTFGLRAPRLSDIRYYAAGVGLTLLSRGVVVGVANGLTHGRAGEQAQNLEIRHISAVGAVVLIAVVVVWAPVTEEILFRGLLLRTFMRRWPFWPSALLSTAIFAGLHTYEVDTVTGALTLAAAVGCLGLVDSYLNRLSDSLVPGMLVHATFNLISVVVLIAQAN